MNTEHKNLILLAMKYFAYISVFFLSISYAIKPVNAVVFVESYEPTIIMSHSSSASSGLGNLVLNFDIVGNSLGSSGSATLQFSGGSTATQSALIEPKMTNIPLVYPNPFQFSDNPKICYRLTSAMDVRIQFFDMYGHSLSKMDISAGLEGGAFGYNRVPITVDNLGGERSSGIYFYIVINKGTGKILGKGSLALKP